MNSYLNVGYFLISPENGSNFIFSSLMLLLSVGIGVLIDSTSLFSCILMKSLHSLQIPLYFNNLHNSTCFFSCKFLTTAGHGTYIDFLCFLTFNYNLFQPCQCTTQCLCNMVGVGLSLQRYRISFLLDFI